MTDTQSIDVVNLILRVLVFTAFGLLLGVNHF